MQELTKEEIIKHAQDRGLRRALILTALPLETRAVRAHLKHLGSVASRDGTVLECGEFTGKFGSWVITVAESGAGTHPAHSVVTSAHRDFDDFFDVAAFSGIGASRKPEAPIGSVVASNFLYFPYSGKIDSSGFKSRPHSLPVDHKLVGYARKVERDGEWQSRIRALLKSELPDKADYPQPYPPNAFIAPIVSIEAVSADPDSELEKLIANNFNDALALDMEGYGALHAASREETPLIVIRGISDMRGGKTPEKDVIHQPVAASHAAAFVFELLDTWARFQPNKRMPLQPTSLVENPRGNGPVASADDSEENHWPIGRTRIVLNFAGTAEDFPREKIDRILNVIRSITNDESVALVGTEEGSFRLVIEASQGTLAKLRTPEAVEALSRDTSAKLVGVLDETDYREALDLEDSLHRASRDLLHWPQNLPDGRHFKRPELDQLLSIIRENDSSTTVLLGDPGSGKSALLAALGQEFIKEGLPFLAIKADLLDPSIRTEEDLSAALGLTVSISSLFLQIAGLRPVVLLMDQLDALAGYIDLRTGRLSVLLNLVRKLSGRRNIHIVLSSRTFEFEHDTRLKTVRAESVLLALPPWSAVLQVLEAHGIQASGWPTDAQELLRTPQSLATYLKFNELAGQQPFRSYQAMLDQLWNEQILSQPNGHRISWLAGSIAEGMAEKETLWLATARFEDQARDLDVLIARGILTDFDGSRSRIGFSHQTVFEHALARSFAQKEGRLSTFVRDRQPSLFIRPKLWVALTYLRDVESPTYEAELQTIWSIDNLRLHLKNLLIEFLGQQEKPTNTEVQLMDQALQSSYRRVALQAMTGSHGWLNLFATSHIARAMVNKDEANLVAAMLDKAWSFAPEAVKCLIQRHWLQDASFDSYTWTVIQESPSWNDALVGMAKTVLTRTDVSAFAFQRLVSTVGVEYPEIALKLILARLELQLAKALEESAARAALPAPEGEDRASWRLSQSAPDMPIRKVIEQQNGWEELEALAQTHPKLFLKYIWPWFQQALESLRALKDDDGRPGFSLRYKLDLRFPEESSLDLPEPPLLGALAAAVEALASGDPKDFLEWLEVHEGEDATSAQRIFAHALASQPEKFAERAARFLLDDTNRFYLGSVEDSSGTTKRLVKSVSPFWSEETLRLFENSVLQHSPTIPSDLEPEGRRSFLNIIRRTKLGILDSLPSEHTSEEVRRTIAEERRRFPRDKIGSEVYGPRWIGSPIAAQSLSRAKDEDILNAFRNLPDSSGWDHPKDWSKGGNIQLAREFAEFAKNDPQRAMRIISKFEPSFGTRASGNALGSLAETVDAVTLLDLIESLDKRGFKGEEFRSGAARAIERLIERDASISDASLAMLEGWVKDTSGYSQEEEDTSDEGGLTFGESDKAGNESDATTPEQGSVLWGQGGISVLPNGNYPILEAITRVYLQRGDYGRLIVLYEEHLQVKENPKVWQSLLRYFQYMRSADPEALTKFLYALFERYPDLLNTYDAAVMLAYMHWRVPDAVHEVLLRWKDDQRGRLQQTFGELVTLIALVQPALSWPRALLDEIVEKDELAAARVGAAYSAVHLWNERDQRSAASRLLQSIVPKADEPAWAAIFDLFRLVDEITPEEEWVSLLEVISAYLERAENIESSYIIDRLQTLLPHQGPLVAKIARQVVEKWGSELGDLRTGTAADAPDLVDLAITLHRLGPETREMGTSLFEDLLVVSTYTARETLDQIDNRFRNAAPRARRRLPRRKRRTSKRAQ